MSKSFRPLFSTFFLTLFCGLLCAQTYWQQAVDYKINVSLDDKKHELTGNLEVVYTNNSPDTLSFIWFHLWPNAYKNLNTAFAQQQLENRSTEFYFSKPEQRGYIDSLDFKSGGQKLEWKLDSAKIDICKVLLPQPLKSGERITISTPFHVKIPASFSRLGHVAQSYQITQWYPKPAVYNKNGWHPMSYLDQGEFYSEFGSFDVQITLPKNYVVAASGNLQNEEELAWLTELAEKTSKIESFENARDFPASDSTLKTLRYKLENAHDFAWFADKRYHVLKGEVELPNSKRKVTTWAMFTNIDAKLWKNSLEYLHDATLYYSKWIGDYQYDQVTAVEGALSAGGGMEYPTITIIGGTNNALDLETVIMHEVGHNWFYGILGTNERDHAWMDEGINSFYEMRYLYTKYPGRKWPDGFNAEKLRKLFDMEDYTLKFQNELFYLFNARQHLDQPSELPSQDFTSLNYGAIVYGKTALLFDHLKAYLGDSLFDSVMQKYFSEWKFKHPQPEDLRALFEAYTGKNLTWFFDDLIATSQKLDYKIAAVKKDKANNIHTLHVANKTGIAAPIAVSAIRKDTVAKTIWLEGFEGEKEIEIVNDNYEQYRIDFDRTTTEFNRKNNNYRLRGLMHKAERLRFQFLGSLENPTKAQLFFSPAVGWNNYDKTLIGFAFYNHFLPFKELEFELVPMFGTGSVQFAGIGRVAYTFYTKGSKVHNVNLSIGGRRFSYDLVPEVLNYNKIQPVLTLTFRKKYARSPVDKSLSFRHIHIWQDFREYNRTELVLENTVSKYFVNEVAFNLENTRVINPFRANITVQQGKDFVRSFAEFNYKLTYNKKNKGLHVRLFAGGFLWNDRESGVVPDARFRMNFGTGREQFQKDFLFDEYFFGRNETEIFSSQQIVTKEGGFRSRNSFGQTDKWLATIHLNSTIPGKIPIRPYTTIGMFGQENAGFNLAYELGLAFVIIPDMFEIYFPLVSIVQDKVAGTQKWYVGFDKNDTDNLYYREKYWGLITFQFNIKKMNPFEVVRKAQF
ncbi:MAG: M1 family metallopeptidase [Chitinophagales bacterium]|nr:M1 family metallopeptidase [Chitinophagales bacterium]